MFYSRSTGVRVPATVLVYHPKFRFATSVRVVMGRLVNQQWTGLTSLFAQR